MKDFKVEPYYEPETDSIICYLEDTPSYEKFINDKVSLFLAFDDNRIVGFDVKCRVKSRG